MRARTTGFAALALGILIGAGGCSADSPTSPLTPGGVDVTKGGYIQGGGRSDTTSVSVQGGGYIQGGG
jgi:hypothetical protein